MNGIAKLHLKPDNNDGIARIINTPPRRIGDRTIKSLMEEADRTSTTLWSLVLAAVQDTRRIETKLTSQTTNGLSSFVDIILTAQKRLADPAGSTITTRGVLDYIITKISFKDYLKKAHETDHEDRWDNVEELIVQAESYSNHTDDDDDEALPQIDGIEQGTGSESLARFLANVSLASEVQSKDEDGAIPKPQVTISTVHAAKGLEWPVVFIPGVHNAQFPHSRAEDTDEERRLLYVAMTRAKALLYMSYAARDAGGEENALSPFLDPKTLRHHTASKGPTLPTTDVHAMAQILRRSMPTHTQLDACRAQLSSLNDDFGVRSEHADATKGKRPGQWEYGAVPAASRPRQAGVDWRSQVVGADNGKDSVSKSVVPGVPLTGFVKASIHLGGRTLGTSVASSAEAIRRPEGPSRLAGLLRHDSWTDPVVAFVPVHSPIPSDDRTMRTVAKLDKLLDNWERKPIKRPVRDTQPSAAVTTSSSDHAIDRDSCGIPGGENDAEGQTREAKTHQESTLNFGSRVNPISKLPLAAVCANPSMTASPRGSRPSMAMEKEQTRDGAKRTVLDQLRKSISEKDPTTDSMSCRVSTSSAAVRPSSNSSGRGAAHELSLSSVPIEPRKTPTIALDSSLTSETFSSEAHVKEGLVGVKKKIRLAGAGGISRRSLGVKPSMNGWANRKHQ